MMVPWNVSRSTIAAQSRGSVRAFVQPENASVGTDSDRRLLYPLGEDLEEEFRAAAVEFDLAQLIDDEQVHPPVSGDGAGELFLIVCLRELVHEPSGERVDGGGVDVVVEVSQPILPREARAVNTATVAEVGRSEQRSRRSTRVRPLWPVPTLTG